MFAAWIHSDLHSNNLKINQIATFMNLQSKSNNWFYGNHVLMVYSDILTVLVYGSTTLIRAPVPEVTTCTERCLPLSPAVILRHHPGDGFWVLSPYTLTHCSFPYANCYSSNDWYTIPLESVPFYYRVLMISLSSSYFKNKINVLSGF